ncbi:hypothetical protein [Frankia sp. Cppng1_Ct_nod]|uniref:hypothetical protein n=1 Tax=Frankia sp. Cppng1_Ct_nod TaxID=2897162 RepID=UPI0010415C7B|nr:hypothetical protein [Frankia sp. Cppng1_Ct_nod]
MVTEPKPSGYELSSAENERIFREQIIPHEMGNATRQAQPAASDMELLPTPPRGRAGRRADPGQVRPRRRRTRPLT